MSTPSTRKTPSRKLVRTSVLLPEEADRALREIARRADRPISREIRRAIEAHIERGRTRRASELPSKDEQEAA